MDDTPNAHDMKNSISVLSGTLEHLLASRGIRLELDYDPQPIWHLDQDLVVGVLAHAINDAIHYTCDTVRLAIRETGGGFLLRLP